MTTARVLVCRVAWMDFYEGVATDQAVGGGSYVEEHGFGHEVFNFKVGADGTFRGYVRPPSGGQEVRQQRMNMERLGADSNDARAVGVTIFWCATHPQRRGTYVVGWYDDAIIHRQWQASLEPRPLPDGTDAGYMMEARSAHRIPSDDRLFLVPRAQSAEDGVGMGQANIWYLDERPEFAARLLAYRQRVSTGAVAPEPVDEALPPARLVDTEERQRIELAAMRATEAWCRERGLACRDVSGQNVGWDLEAGEGPAMLRIEVKGTSRELAAAIVELTPNEYANLGRNRLSYRVSIVAVDAEPPDVAMFAWIAERQRWIANGRTLELQLEERISARAAVVGTT